MDVFHEPVIDHEKALRGDELNRAACQEAEIEGGVVG
jgi:hypothetical protein